MKRNDKCLGCLVNQVVKVAEMTNAQNKPELYKKVFSYFSTMDFNQTSPEIIGDTFAILKEHIGQKDPYKQLKANYNQLFLSMENTFRIQIESSNNPFEEALKLAILGNIIDFNPSHSLTEDIILSYFKNMHQKELFFNDSKKLFDSIQQSHTLLYIGDNCGEVCLDKLFLEQIKKVNPRLELYFAVRGEAVVNDTVASEAYEVGIDSYAKIISNGDKSLGTILKKTSAEFNEIYQNADIIIAKGQANYESLSEERQKEIYFLLMTKCDVIASAIGVPTDQLMCFLNK